MTKTTTLINGWQPMPVRVWRSPNFNFDASIFGAMPQGQGWEVVNTGKWTLMNINTNETLMRVPFDSEAEAIAYAEKNVANKTSYGG